MVRDEECSGGAAVSLGASAVVGCCLLLQLASAAG